MRELKNQYKVLPPSQITIHFDFPIFIDFFNQTVRECPTICFILKMKIFTGYTALGHKGDPNYGRKNKRNYKTKIPTPVSRMAWPDKW